MSLIQVKELSFCYDGSYDEVFSDVSFYFDTEYRCALIGRNGTGKTTFLKLLMNQYQYQGEIMKNVDCQYFPYTVNDQSQMTIDICYDIEPHIEIWQIEKEIRLLDVDVDVLYREFQTLSKGEQTKVLLALLFLKDNSYLLIDEPTNHLDQESRRIVADYLKKQSGFLLVSHDRYFIDICCDHVISINNTTIDVVNGNFTSWYDNKLKQDESEKTLNEKLKKDIKRLDESRKQSAKWSDKVEKTKNGTRVAGLRPDKGHIGHMAAKMMKRSKSIEQRRNKAIDDKKTLLKDVEEFDDLKLFPLKYGQSQLICLSHVSLSYDDKVLWNDLNITINESERVLLKGKNGCGKSSLVSFIMHQDIQHQGDCYIKSHLKISYVPQDCSYLTGDMDEFILKHDVDLTLVKTILRKFGFSRDDLVKQLHHLSEGQKKKVMLSISLASQAHLYIWDEPLNYIDIFSRIQIERLILEYQPTLLFVEHDEFFQKNIATKVLDFDNLI
ncbi:MAG: ABC-F type ribosomal protection protein [Coprobacillus sp.]